MSKNLKQIVIISFAISIVVNLFFNNIDAFATKLQEVLSSFEPLVEMYFATVERFIINPLFGSRDDALLFVSRKPYPVSGVLGVILITLYLSPLILIFASLKELVKKIIKRKSEPKEE